MKQLIPSCLKNLYHYLLAYFSNIYFGKPSEKMRVIGVTGTNGKTTTVLLISEALASMGKKVGLTSTAEIQIGEKRTLNDMKMTMPGRAVIQKLLHKMKEASCEYAVIETSSQGIEQYRHIGVNYDVAVCTNLTPEHIEAHGGFENYKDAKGKFFSYLAKMPKKNISGVIVPKISVVNLDDPHSSYFLQFSADKKYGYSIESRSDISGVSEVRAENVLLGKNGSSFAVQGICFETNLLGRHNVYNCLSAVTVMLALGFPLSSFQNAFRKILLPGRMEFINEGQNFAVIIDYAPEPQGVSNLYNTVGLLPKKNIIHVLGSCGGGRDRRRRPVLGRLAGKFSQYVIVTNEDPYDDDPNEIIEEVAAGAREAGKRDNKNLFLIFDRREAIRKAFMLAEKGDMVLITGKGCEQAIVTQNGKKIPWDDRKVAREELRHLLQSNTSVS